MNRQNFEAKEKFPLSTQALTFMQDMVMATAQLALIGGDNYILSGCETTGLNAAPGIIVINGEVMPFEGGAIVDTITVVETVIPVTANGIEYDNVRVSRKAKFATGSGANYYPWSAFRPLSTNKQLEEAKATVQYVNDEIAKLEKIPAGVIVMWSGSTTNVPKGWQLCDNSLIQGTGKRTPDLRGRFVIGYNNADYDYNSIGKTGGNKEVTLTSSQIPAHNHSFKNYYYAESNERAPIGADGYDDIPRACVGSHSTDNDNRRLFYMNSVTYSTGSGTAHENRPPYYVLAYIIKL